jgi:uncharacterized protein (DUF433 family)
MPKVLHPRITSDPSVWGGSPCIAGTRIAVRIIVTSILRHGVSSEELLTYYPHVILAAIYNALSSYYYDSREEIERDITANDAVNPVPPSS